MAEVFSSVLSEVIILLLIFLFTYSKATDANIANFVYFVKNPKERYTW